jgi:hypothetical protein
VGCNFRTLCEYIKLGVGDKGCDLEDYRFIPEAGHFKSEPKKVADP